MSRPINRNRVGSKAVDGIIRDKLEAKMVPGTLDGGPIVLTFHSEDAVREVPGRFGDFLALRFEEFPDNQLHTNATQEDALLGLVDAGILPNDFDEWGGCKVAWQKRQNVNPETGARVIKLYPLAASDQAAGLDTVEGNTPKTAKKRSGRRSGR